MSEMHKYSYDGPVVIFDRCVCNQWRVETFAPSAAKAKNNLRYRYNKENNKETRAKVDLPGKITKIY